MNYVNNGDFTINRGRAKISVIKIFAHGLPSILDFGLDGDNEESPTLAQASLLCQNIQEDTSKMLAPSWGIVQDKVIHNLNLYL